MKNRFWNKAGLLTMAAALSLGLAATAAAQDKKPAPKTDAKKTADDKSTKDILVLRSGQKVEGKIQKETETSVDFLVVMASGLSAARTYEKSEILDIQRDIPADAVEAKPVETSSGKVSKDVTVVGEGKTKAYLVELTGEFSRDVSLTPMKELARDFKKIQPDCLIIKLNCDFVNRYGEKEPEWKFTSGSYDQLELVRNIEVILTDQILHDPEWKVKPRLVFWVKKALGGAGFLPFVGKEVYYTSDAKHGNIGILDLLFVGVGDEVVQEKQRSLREGRAEGLAIKGGHPVEILRAMSRIDYVLSVSFPDGKPAFHEDTSGEILLTDDGSLNGGRRDTVTDVLRGRGNDILTLDADMAKKLGMSNGTVDTDTELMDALGYARNYTLMPGSSKTILAGWSKGVRDAEIKIRELFRDLDKVEVQAPGGWQERQNARSTQINILNDVLALLKRYGEAISPYEIGDMPDAMSQDIRIQIDQIKQAMRLDKRR